MQQPDALRATARAPGGPGPERDPARSRRALVVAVLVATLLLGVTIGIGIGIAIGPGSTEIAAAAPVTAPANLGQLAVSSLPTDGNVTVDGRFVGVTPVERVDLDPGRHSIVIDAFGYQPYAGTLAIEPRGKVTLKVLLAPVGGDGTTSGNLTGPGKATSAPVPSSALLPAAAAADPARGSAAGSASPPGAGARRTSPAAEPPPPPPPPRPRRDCSGEKSRCRDGCSRASTDCSFRCPYCGSCPTNLGWDECNRQCNSCRSSCDQNTRFCESGCDSQENSCEASQRD